MSALSIQPTYPIFTDIDGQPLEAGYVWLGTATLDPQVNPIAAFWDAALTIPAAQPIRTLGGYPSNSGTPARLYVNSDYSIRVMNKNGSTVYSAPTATEQYSGVVVSGVNASEVIYDPAGTGAVATTVQTKLRESVSAKDFGAVGDGVADDTAAIQAAIDSLTTGTVFLSGSLRVSTRYTETRDLVVTRYAIKMKPGVNLVSLTGATLLYAGSSATDSNALNQFYFISNDTTLAEFDGFSVSGLALVNDGDISVYPGTNIFVSGIQVYGGDNSKAEYWLKNVSITDIYSDGLRVVSSLLATNSNSLFPILNASYTRIKTDRCGSSNCTVVGVSNLTIDDIVCTKSDYDIVNLFHARDVNVSNISGRNINEALVMVECQQAHHFVDGVSVTNVNSKTGVITINTSAVGSYIKNVALSNCNVPVLILNNSSATAGTVSRIVANNVTLNCGASSRASYINNVSDVILDLLITGAPTISGVQIDNSDRVQINGSITVTSSVPCLFLDRARATTGKVRLKGGTNGVYLRGVVGTMAGVELEVNCSGQSVAAVNWDGTISTSHKVHIWGNYSDQALLHGNTTGSYIELQKGNGVALTVASDICPIPKNDIHYVNAESGVTDNVNSIVAGLLGQVVTLGATPGTTLTFQHATSGGNIRTLSAASVTVTQNNTITLLFNGANWTQT